MYAKRLLQATTLAAVASSVAANPLPIANGENGLDKRGPPLITDDLLVFDAPGFVTEGNEMQGSFRVFSYVRQIDTGIVSTVLTSAIEALGIEIGNKAGNLLERTKLFLAIPRSEVTMDIAIAGCNKVTVGPTSKGGLLEQKASIGSCGGAAKEITATAPSLFSTRKFTGKLFPNPPTGFGVISDVDDTIKVSNVLDTKEAIKKLLIEDHQAVTGMPELYSQLNKELSNPAWFYLTGSPYQLYPSLRKFIFDTYPQGPMIVQNLTITDIQSVLKLILDDDAVLNYKIDQMEKIQSYYPGKKFVTIGDSTQADPEAYAEIARRYPDFVQCIWIREVANANNTAERFAAAFQGVPASKVNTFADPAELAGIDVANGQCN